MLEAGVHAFRQHMSAEHPKSAQELEAIVTEISQRDSEAANMIHLALRENSPTAFIAALNEAAS